MDEELISKKELLNITGISYGQLYRWKRKKLIPEDWFIKKSSYTGQETFFPKKDILSRINKIKDFKEDSSLDELANIFSPQVSEISLSKEELIEQNIVSQATLNIYFNLHNVDKRFSFEEILFLLIVEKLLLSGEVGIEEGNIVLKTLEEHYKNFEGRYCDVVLIRKFGVVVCLLLLIPNEFYLESGAKLLSKINVSQCVEELKLKLLN